MTIGAPGPPSIAETTLEAAAAELAQADDLLGQRRAAESIARFNRAEAVGASADRCRAGRWQAFMLLGDFSRAWLESDVIRRSAKSDPHFWNGSSLHGRRVIVRCLHGLGDAIQFMRYAPLIREQASSLIVEVPPAMLEVAPFFNGIEQVITWGNAAPPISPKWDVQVEVMELPYLFRSTITSLPAPNLYLRLPEAMARATHMKARCNRLPHVGVVWSAGEWDPSRSIPIGMLEPLLGMGRKISFLSLQREQDNVDWFEMVEILGIEAHALPGNGLLAMAAAIASLDLVVTVDTMAAHLAAAMGIPTWVLLQHRADWRWLLERSTSPWYPSMRLFRQPVQGDWEDVLEDVQDKLLSWSRSFERGGADGAKLG